jgi:hypothetical protein
MIVLLAAAAAPAAAAEYDAFQSGKWDGTANRSDDGGEFTHCVMMDRTSGDILFFFSIRRENVFQVFFANQAWRLALDKRYPVTLEVDGNGLGRYEASAASETVLRVDFGTGRAEFQALQRGSQLTLKAAQRDFTFSLAGTGQALQRLQDCVDRHLAGRAGASPAGPDAPSSNPFKPGTQSGNPFRPVPRGYTRKEVAHILSKAGIRNPEFMSDDEVKRYPGFDYLWTMAGKIGFVSQFLREPDEPVDELMVRYMATLTHECRGKASSTDKPATARGPVVLKESAVFCVGQEDFHAYAVALFLPNKVSVFGYMGWGTGNRASTAAATEKLASGLRQLYFLD